MATIKKHIARSGEVSWHVRIRRRGHKTACASFKRKFDAQRWIIETEQSVVLGRYFERVEAQPHTLHEAIERYVQEGLASANKFCHLKRWDTEIGHIANSGNYRPAILEIIDHLILEKIDQ